MSERDVVTVRGLRKSYGGRVVVDGLDLAVSAGEIVGLIGANGAGKTTTVECVQGLRKPDAGQLRVLGYDPVTQAGELRPLIGSQLQDSALPDRLRVAEAVELFGTPRARDGGELLSRFGLAPRRRSAFGSLSGGERQRLFLVLALLNRPRLVILDELTQGLDPAARRGVWAAVRQLHDEGATVLLVTHEMDEAEALCGRVVVMRAGRVLDATRAHHDDLVAQRLGLVHLMGHQQHRGALVVQLAHRSPHAAPRGRVQALGQLVQDHQPRPVEQGEDEEKPLSLPAAQRREHRPAPLRQPELLEQLAAVPGAHRAEQVERLGHPQPVRQRGGLELAAHQRPQLLGLRHRVEAEHPQPPGIGFAQPLDALDGRRLAGAVGADQADDLTGGDVEVQSVHHQPGPVRLA